MDVFVFATLRPIVGGRKVQVPLPDGATVQDLVDALAARWPDLEEHLFEEDRSLSRRVNIFLDGRNIRWLDGLATLVGPDQKVDIFPPVAGG